MLILQKIHKKGKIKIMKRIYNDPKLDMVLLASDDIMVTSPIDDYKDDIYQGGNTPEIS